MKEFNLELIKGQVRTQYGDYSGYIEIDGHSGADLFKLCEDNGVNLKNSFLLSFGMSESTINGIGQRNKVICRALVLENYGDSFDIVSKTIQSQNGKAKAKQFTFDIEYKDLTKYIKRYDFMVLTKISNYITDLKIEGID